MSVQKLDKFQRDCAYDAIPRAVPQGTISADALAVWVYLMTKPETWVPKEGDVRSRFNWGRQKYLNAMAELRDVGLVSVAVIQGEDGRMQGRSMIVHAVPVERQDGASNRKSVFSTFGEIDPLENKEGLEKKEKTRVDSPRRTAESFQLPAAVDAKVWAEWVEYRKEIRKPMTPKSERLNARVLESLKPQEQREVVEKAIRSQWQGLYAPKPNPKGKQESIREVVL